MPSETAHSFQNESLQPWRAPLDEHGAMTPRPEGAPSTADPGS